MGPSPSITPFGVIPARALLQQRCPHGLPAIAIGCANQAAIHVGRIIGIAVKPRRIAAGLAVQQPAGRVVPGIQAIVEQKVPMPAAVMRYAWAEQR